MWELINEIGIAALHYFLRSTPPKTEDPWKICEDVCREESEPGLFPFPGVASCCEEGGLHCDCNACYDGFGCIGQHEHCREGEVFCEESRQCVALDNCDAHTCCPNLPPSYKNTGSGLSIRYSCQPDTQKHDSFDHGSGMVTELLEPNMVLSYNLQSENLHKVEINMSLPSPLAGKKTTYHNILFISIVFQDSLLLVLVMGCMPLASKTLT